MTHYGQTEVIVCDDEFELGRRAATAVAAARAARAAATAPAGAASAADRRPPVVARRARRAATAVAGRMRESLRSQDEISMVLAAGESQNVFLSALSQERDLDWQRVVCFNMDDFWDVRMPECFTCGYQTRTQLYDKVKPRQFHLVRFNAPDPEAEAKRFGGLIARAGAIDILCQGIGTSGHLALNEPGATDFRDPELVRVVDLAEQSKRQLREDPNFRDLGYIPHKGITMTIPALLAARHIFTMTPLALKREILTRMMAITYPTAELPATILYQTPGILFVDRNSCPLSLLSVRS